MTEDDVVRFTDKVVKSSGCWIWDAGTFSNGYGVFRLNGKNKRAHRIAWEISNGPIPVGMLVCHKCDTPACVNPSHLFVGTAFDNNRDMYEKGRANYTGPKTPPRGERHWKSRLSEDQVREIRRIGRMEKQCDIARRLGVSKQTISAVLRREIWVGVEP